MANMSVYLNSADHQKVRDYAAEAGLSISGFVTEAVRRHVKYLEERGENGFLGADKPAMMSDLYDARIVLEQRLAAVIVELGRRSR